MKVCSQCHGNGKVKTGGVAINAPNSATFTSPVDTALYPCPSCLGNGYSNSFGVS